MLRPLKISVSQINYQHLTLWERVISKKALKGFI